MDFDCDITEYSDNIKTVNAMMTFVIRMVQFADTYITQLS